MTEMSEEHKAKMAEGRRRYEEIRAAQRAGAPPPAPPAPAPMADPEQWMEWLSGLTKHNCAAACKADRCVISRDGICVHPFKGGLHSPHLMKPEVCQRFQAAKDKIELDDLKRRQSHA